MAKTTKKKPINPVQLLAHEIFDKLAKARSDKTRLEILKEHKSDGLQTLLQATYHPGIKMNLPEGEPPFDPWEEDGEPTNLLNRTKELITFVSNKELKRLGKVRIEYLFIQFLEGIHQKDAAVLLQVKDKQPVKGLELAVIQEAYPELAIS